MPKTLRVMIHVLMVLIGLVAMYAILNAGNPKSLLRPLLPDPAHDLYAAMIASGAVFVLGFFVFFFRDREDFRQLIALNADRIRSLRRKGKEDGQIADSMLAALGSYNGYRHWLARKKLIVYLAEFQ